MRWFGIALGLTAMLVAGVAWIGLRDWRPGDALDAQRVQALHAGRQILQLTEGRRPCVTCDVTVRKTAKPHVWRVALRMPGRRLCFDVDNDRFGVSGDQGVDGARPVPCTTG